MPAFLAYYDHFIESVFAYIWLRYFLVGGTIGLGWCSLFSMAAVGLTELLDGSS